MPKVSTKMVDSINWNEIISYNGSEKYHVIVIHQDEKRRMLAIKLDKLCTSCRKKDFIFIFDDQKNNHKCVELDCQEQIDHILLRCESCSKKKKLCAMCNLRTDVYYYSFSTPSFNF
jgi:hypothetical protein